MQFAIALLALFLTAPTTCALIPSTIAQTSIPFNASFKTGSNDLNYSDPLVAAPTSTNSIVSQQTHVIYINETSVFITWITGNGTTYVGNVVPPANTVEDGGVKTTLTLQHASNRLVQQQTFKSEPYYYIYQVPATANVAGVQNYVSGTVNTVLLTGLTPGEQYSYSIVQAATGRVMRSNLTFYMPDAVGTPSMRFVLMGM